MKYTKIYIGSNNTTGILEVDKIVNILNRYQSGYTIMQGLGYWAGKSENTAIIEIYGNCNLFDMIPELKTELKQKSILVSESIKEVNFND